ncbi:hypothetical protein Bca4012_093193 [Brassica carinata]|uniref:Uncharacterized protein n=1 Tax=Brassica carinata TaxID=52824 RepID=A0A8X7TWC5_BRACI|nr:hypothetical protein Bca52824_075418 [Brassica carinata]
MIRKSPESLVFVTVGNVSHRRRDPSPSKGDHDLSLSCTTAVAHSQSPHPLMCFHIVLVVVTYLDGEKTLPLTVVQAV